MRACPRILFTLRTNQTKRKWISAAPRRDQITNEAPLSTSPGDLEARLGLVIGQRLHKMNEDKTSRGPKTIYFSYLPRLIRSLDEFCITFQSWPFLGFLLFTNLLFPVQHTKTQIPGDGFCNRRKRRRKKERKTKRKKREQATFNPTLFLLFL